MTLAPAAMKLGVMGVAASGKSTVALAVADRLGWTFADGDAFHPPENVARMAAGQPLEDVHRWPWLDAMARWLEARPGQPVVLACSALRRVYRERLPGVTWVYLDVPREVLAARLASRAGHFFNPALLDSQLATLEAPGPDERALTVDGTRPVDVLVEQIIAALGAGPQP